MNRALLKLLLGAAVVGAAVLARSHLSKPGRPHNRRKIVQQQRRDRRREKAKPHGPRELCGNWGCGHDAAAHGADFDGPCTGWSREGKNVIARCSCKRWQRRKLRRSF